jgi:hypothetical protein
VKRALEGFQEVAEVDFVPHRELFGVEYHSDVPRGEEFKAAVRKVVIAPGVRKMLGEIGGRENPEAPAEDNPVH